MSDNHIETSTNFIHDMIEEKINTGGIAPDAIVTRFPPEPNGYLHIGHAKSICLNFGTALKYGGKCNLRFDDTNPSKEETEYVDSIREDVRWLGFDWADREYYASDYFDALYDFAIELIKKGKAYVCDLNAEETRQYRGTLTEPGRPSPYRNRSVEENLNLFQRMTSGEFDEGSRVLRAKIDMSSPNMNMRDPVIYRIMKQSHHRTGDKWLVYPMYDFAHGLSDMLEGITHSICTLEFEDHRPLYDWFLDELDTPSHPQQIEFARLNMTYTVMSKRKLLDLVSGGYVHGWDDPRMPTLSGMRRRGYTPESIKEFSRRIGVNKMNSTVDISLLDFCLREDLNQRALRVMAVLNPVKLVVTNYPEDQVEFFDADNNPEDESAGTRKIPFAREIFIENDDFSEDPPKNYFRLAPGKEVRLKHAYYITCTDVMKDHDGNILEIHCTYDPQSKGGWTDDGRKVKGTLHWVSVEHAIDGEVRLYDHLFKTPTPDRTSDFVEELNPQSLKAVTGCKLEPSLQKLEFGAFYQFLRLGYFVLDQDSEEGYPVYNRTVTLRDTWAKISQKQ